MTRLASLILTLLAVGVASALPGDARSPDPAPEFGETIDVEIVEIEVHATDDSGRAVTDLAQEDFVVRVDGREVELAGFYASGDPEPADEAAEPSPDPSPPSSSPSPPDPAPAPGPGVSFVVYVENGYLDPGQRGRALEAVEGFLAKTKRPGDRAMVVSHGLALQVIEPFTADLQRIHSALDALSGVSGRGVHNRAEWVGILRDLELAGQSTGCAELRQRVMSGIRGLYNEAQMSLGALRTVAESVAGVEGRKMLLYVGAGPPIRPGEDLLAILEEVCGRDPMAALEFDLTDEIHRIATEANTAGVTIHTLDAGGLRGFMGGTVTPGVRGLFTPQIERLTLANVHDTFFALAEQTGGRAILNANDPRADLERVGEDLSTFYSLAFADPHDRDGRVHRVEVRVERPGVRLRYRENYRSQPVTEELSESTLASLYHGEGTPLDGGRLVPGEPSVGPDGIELRVQVDLPFAGITLIPGERGLLLGKLRLFVALRDVQGRVTEVQEVQVPLRVSREKYPDGPPERLLFPLSLTLAAGEQTLGVTVWDELGGSVGVLRHAIDIERKGGRAYLRTKS